MSIQVSHSTPMLHVAEIEKSIRFYELLGFRTIDTDGTRPLGWARLHCEGGAVMFLRAENPIDASAQSVLLYMYVPDLAALREHLLSEGIASPAISYPEYMPSGELQVKDPDGYSICISHWARVEQEAWERRIALKK